MTADTLQSDVGAPARAQLQERVRAGRRIVGVGVGCGLTARCAEIGRADLIGLYNSAPMRLAGLGSLAGLLAMGNANDQALSLARQVRPCVTDTPLVAGLLAADRTRSWDTLFDELRLLGVAGVQNSPTAGLITGALRKNLEETNLGFDLEVELIRQARAKGFLAVAYVFTSEGAQSMVDAGVDIVVAHLGLTGTGGAGARTTVSLDDAVRMLDGLVAVVQREGTGALVCAHGGPIATVDDFAYVARRVPNLNGFFGASTFERLPIEAAVTAAVRAFTELEVSA